MVELISETKQRARKDHTCDYCEDVIKKGHLYNRAFLTDGSEAWVWKSHLSCDALVEALDMYDGNTSEGIGSETFREYVINKWDDMFLEVENPAYKPTFLDKLIDVKLAVLDYEKYKK